ncbi:hypothetical protein C8R44DRAFT_738655 [Mycena epipterygia]|nr:hypothetical protein C8R44DRAFT_738655 [Mycena epipterygia]
MSISFQPTNSVSNIMVGIIVLALAALVIHRASPMRLTRALVIAMAEAEEAYLESRPFLHSLQIEVSHIREASLRNSVPRRSALNNEPSCREILESEVKLKAKSCWTRAIAAIRFRIRPAHFPVSGNTGYSPPMTPHAVSWLLGYSRSPYGMDILFPEVEGFCKLVSSIHSHIGKVPTHAACHKFGMYVGNLFAPPMRFLLASINNVQKTHRRALQVRRPYIGDNVQIIFKPLNVKT